MLFSPTTPPYGHPSSQEEGNWDSFDNANVTCETWINWELKNTIRPNGKSLYIAQPIFNSQFLILNSQFSAVSL